MNKSLITILCVLALAVSVSAVPLSQLDYVDIGDVTSEAGHLGMVPDDWSYIGDSAHNGGGYLNLGGYGGYDGGSANFRGLMGPLTGCSSEHTWATFTMHAGSGSATELVLRHLDGSAGDSFDLYIDGQAAPFAHYSADANTTEVWHTTAFALSSPMSGDIKFRLVATDPATAWCDIGWGQVMVNWAELNSAPGSQIPEFSAIAAGIALAGAATGFVLLRKRR